MSFSFWASDCAGYAAESFGFRRTLDGYAIFETIRKKEKFINRKTPGHHTRPPHH